MFLKIAVLAAVMLLSLFCHCEAGQCTLIQRNVVKVNITCPSGCCVGSSGFKCCGDTNTNTNTTNNNNNNNNLDTHTRYYSGVASPDMNTFQPIVFACLAMLAVPRVQW